ncbi:MAG: hypothetical protein AB7N80_04755 [Bdellovibrionales bacterium]
MAFQIQGSGLFISLTLKSLDQIFDLRDPSPFREKDLDDDFARYLIVAVKEAPEIREVHLNLQIAGSEMKHFSPSDVEQAIHEYFEFEVESVQGELRALFSEARWAAALGLLFLLACQAAGLLLHEQNSLVMEVLKQGLQILGWVALWRPLNLLLYEWWPILRRRRLFQILTRAKTNIQLLEKAP